MARVKFSRKYNHRWPSGAETAYPNNWEGAVKGEVAEAAVAAGAARRVKHPSTTETPAVGPLGGKLDKAKPEARLPGNLPADLAEPQALTPNLSTARDSD